MSNRQMKFDELLFTHLGEFGRYQRIQFTLVCIPVIFVSMHALAWTFSATSLPHRCRLPNEPSTASYWSDSSLLRTTGSNCTDTSKSKCQRYEECRLTSLNEDSCKRGYIFDTEEMKYSAVNRWEIVCERSVLKAVIQSTYYVGQMIGSLVFGFLGDRIGRKSVFFVALMVEIVAGFLMAIVPYWAAYGVARMAVGFAHPGIFVIAVVIGMELVGPSKRKIASVVSGVFFAAGQIFLGTFAYFVRDYRFLQLCIAIPTVLFLSYWWLVPESARWLVAQVRYEEADKILQHAAKVNKARLPDKWWEQLDGPEKSADNRSPSRKYNFLDLLRTPRIRTRALACFFLWPVVSMIYYGVSMKTDFLGGNFYGTFIIGGFAEIPALILLFFLIEKLGRKPLFAGGYFIAALCMLSNVILPEGILVLNLMQFLITKAAITSCYALIYTVTPELFPTVIRNSAMGVCSMIARVGAIISSYIAMWIVERFGKEAMIYPFGSLSLAAGIIVLLFVPETVGHSLPETIEEVEQDQPPNEEMAILSKSKEK